MINPERHDLVIVGAGPAGVSAAATAESERIDTLLLDSSMKIGGQAGTSSFIENYMGFPEGISGDRLMGLMIDQALRFNTEFIAPVRVKDIERTDEGIVAVTDDAETFLGQAVLLSMGVEYRLLRARNLAAYLGRGANYGSPNQSNTYENKNVLVVGGANSAGQAAFHLSEFDACEVHMAIRGGSIEDKMSGYLVDKVKDRKNISVHTNTELTALNGNGHLERVTLKTDDSVDELEIDEVFILIGSVPKTAWLPEQIARDDQGFIIAGTDISADVRSQFMEETGNRPPFANETSMPGVFVAGDVRCGTAKRVALAVGDGASVIPQLHRLRALES